MRGYRSTRIGRKGDDVLIALEERECSTGKEAKEMTKMR